ncbi:MAG: FtsL-like putative cell division protein [Bacteroidales bacterium]|nr:FtsL-like putative cell division protein [Bacteroidales bacterium]MCL2133228.1 FtsL-like putative cell division protein [Bacteroidales bacterium]MCL2133586.1 FtsL-like putative cell division protein [Bacteroidales bacterium]
MKKAKNINRWTTDILRDVLSGRLFSNLILVKYRWYVLFLFGLALTYMAMNYYMERTVKEVEKQEIALKKLQEDYTLRLWQLESWNKRSAVIKQIESRMMELKEPKETAKKIKTKIN